MTERKCMSLKKKVFPPCFVIDNTWIPLILGELPFSGPIGLYYSSFWSTDYYNSHYVIIIILWTTDDE